MTLWLDLIQGEGWAQVLPFTNYTSLINQQM